MGTMTYLEVPDTGRSEGGMLEPNIFGSTLSLGGLLNENLFSDGEADQFLQEMGVQSSRGFGEPAVAEAQSGASSFESTLSGLGTAEDLVSPAPCSSEGFTSLFPTLNSTSQGPAAAESSIPPQQPDLQAPQQGLLILGQLIAALGTSAPPAPQQPPVQLSQNAVPDYSAAFKPTAPPPQQYSTVPQMSTEASKAQTSLKLPNLNAQQQQALQTIMNLGQLGSTKEGKKVRRMLSNRESARRSRHRKQAHVLEIEEKAAAMEAENEGMKLALARATEQELRSMEERTRLYAEISALRTKVEQLEQAELTKLSGGNANKRGASLSSSQGAVSTDSCCDSLPAKRPRLPASSACESCKVLNMN